MSQAISRRDLLAAAATSTAVLALSPLARALDVPVVSSQRIVQALVDRGAFGELTYASGASIEHFATLCRWLGVSRSDRLDTLVARPDRTGQHILIRTARARLIELRLPSATATMTTLNLSLHGTRGACRLTPSGDWIYLHGRTPGDRWEPLSRYAAAASASRLDVAFTDMTPLPPIATLAAASLAAGSTPIPIS